MFDKESYYLVQEKRHGKEKQKLFQNAHVAIAGLGGLGSHVAVMLARLGVGTLTLVDFDVVDETNIHRQHYDLADIGKEKTQALKEQLMRVNPYATYNCYTTKVVPENVVTLFENAQIICEAFDKADQKAMLVEAVLTQLPQAYLVGGNGMADIKSANLMKVQKAMKQYYICGDGVSDVADSCLFAPRVVLCAAMQATQIMRLILKEEMV